MLLRCKRQLPLKLRALGTEVLCKLRALGLLLSELLPRPLHRTRRRLPLPVRLPVRNGSGQPRPRQPRPRRRKHPLLPRGRLPLPMPARPATHQALVADARGRLLVQLLDSPLLLRLRTRRRLLLDRARQLNSQPLECSRLLLRCKRQLPLVPVSGLGRRSSVLGRPLEGWRVASKGLRPLPRKRGSTLAQG